MKYRICTLIVLAASWLPARAIDNLTTLLPEDVTIFSSSTDSNLFERLEDHPIRKAIAASELKKIFAPFMSKQAENVEKVSKIFKDETGKSQEEIQKLFSGPTAVGVNIDIAKIFMMGMGGAAGAEPETMLKGVLDATMVMTFSGDEAMADKIARSYGRIFKEMIPNTATAAQPFKLASFPDEYDATADDYAGIKLHTWKLKKGAKSFIETPSYALIDGTIVLCLSEAGIRAAVDRVKKGGKSLADSPRFAALAKSSKDSDMVSFFDLGSVVKSVMNNVAKQGGAAAGQGLSVVRALGLDKMDFIYMTLDLTKNRSDLELGMTYHGEPGLMKLTTAMSSSAVPTFIPPDVASGSYGGVDFGKILTVVEGLVKEAMPAMGDVIGAQLDEMKKELGVDIRKDILGNIAPDIVSASETLPESAAKADEEMNMEPTILGLKLKNRKALELAVNTIINKTAPDGAMFDKREYKGLTINNMKGAPMGYVFTDDWFFLSMGPQTLLEKTLTRLAKGGDDHLFSLPVVKSALEGLAGGDMSTGFFDLESTLDSLLGMAAVYGEMPGISDMVNLKDLPKKLNLPLVVGTRQYADGSSVRLRIHIAEKKK